MCASFYCNTKSMQQQRMHTKYTMRIRLRKSNFGDKPMLNRVVCMLYAHIDHIFDKLTAIYSSYSSFSQPSMTARLSEFPRCSNPVAVSEAVFRYYGTFTRTFLSMFEILFLDLDLSRCGSWVLQKRNRLRAI